MVINYHNLLRTEIIDNCNEENVYIGSYNDDFDNICCLTFYDSFIEDDLCFNYRTAVRHPQMQVLIRDSSHENAWSRMEAIRELFHSYSYNSGELTLYPKSDIFHLPQDERMRTILILNFKMMIMGYVFLRDVDGVYLRDSDSKYFIVS